MDDVQTLARRLLKMTEKEKTRKEKKHFKFMQKLLQEEQMLHLATTLTDLIFRSSSDERTALALAHAINKSGISDVRLQLFARLAPLFPHFFVSLLKKEMFKQIAPVIAPEKASEWKNFIKEHKKINLNHLGEAILGEEEAKFRIEMYLKTLEDPAIDTVSIKISTLYSQINLLAWEETLAILVERLKLLYRKAGPKKRVMLDMEEYKDLALTVDLFKRVMSEKEFSQCSHGIVLQSYLPESFALQKELTNWAQTRRAPIKLRIVKGANLAAEKVESSLRGWALAPFSKKSETDAQFVKMLEWALTKEHLKHVHIGVGSHNLFDIAYALHLRNERGAQEAVEFEMLKGMCEPMERALQKLAGEVLLYCPKAEGRALHYALPYLLRRLDENTAPQNFLRHIFDIKVDNRVWDEQYQMFEESLKTAVKETPNRTQNRLLAEPQMDKNAPFMNVSDTDFSLIQNRKWAEGIFQKSRREFSLPEERGVDLDKVKSSEKSWREKSVEELSSLLQNCAHLFKLYRGDLIAVMIAEGTKVFEEGDVEVSEAIDFLEYYRKNWEEITSNKKIAWEPKGTVLIAPPWNFPCSIPVGCIAAALMTGNCVLFKPAPETVKIGFLVAQIFWEAGIPKEVLHFVRCPDEPDGALLVKDERVNVVMLTGATSTAQKMLSMRPSLDLIAETGGKNALIITACADRDLAMSDLLKSAFGHAGQKCSACSLAILESEIYDDPNFLNALKNAAQSLFVGSASDPRTKIPPLIRLPEGPLLRALTTLDEGESWLLEPKMQKGNPNLYSPGIKLGVKEGSFTHQTELFGPVLGLMRAKNLQEAIRFANGTPYGLTSGLHTLDEVEQALWKKEIVAGNLYINRTLTGAIVQRQPFGGTKASSFGKGSKAGGPHYLIQLCSYKELEPEVCEEKLPSSLIPLISQLNHFDLSEKQKALWKQAAASYTHHAKRLKTPIDFSHLHGQENFFYMVPHEKITLRVNQNDSPFDALLALTALLVCETPFEISSFSNFFGFTTIVESEEELHKRQVKRVRRLSNPPPTTHGWLELLHYMREVSLSRNTHRYGYVKSEF